MQFDEWLERFHKRRQYEAVVRPHSFVTERIQIKSWLALQTLIFYFVKLDLANPIMLRFLFLSRLQHQRYIFGKISQNQICASSFHTSQRF